MCGAFAVAIDGPVAAGKTTVGRLLATRLSALFFDTGILYRAVAHAVVDRGIDPDDDRAIGELAGSLDVDLQVVDGRTRLIVDGADISDALRTPEIDRTLPSVSANPDVRRSLLSMQRDIARGRKTVVVGRDIGTVVLPEAELKIYLDAERDVRATRRYQELREREVEIEWETVYRDLRARDQRDLSREHAPLSRAADAIVIDASTREIADVVDIIAQLAAERGYRCSN